MAHEQKPLSMLRDVAGIPYIGEEDENGTQVAPSLLYIKKEDGTFEPIGTLNALPVAVGNMPRTFVRYAGQARPADAPEGSELLEIDTSKNSIKLYVFNGAGWVLLGEVS